jgi:phytoene synthase
VSDSVVASSEVAIAQGSRSFAAAARLFDRATRDDAVMLYAWCRHCDDVIDGQTLGHGQDQDFRDGQRERLELLKVRTAEALAGQTGGDAIFEALRRVVTRHSIPARYPQELLGGFAMDVSGRRYATIGETLDYCYHVAGVVGVMMAMIMGSREPKVLDRACDLGIAFQLTNIARDVVDDARAGRVYVPADVLAKHGLAAVDPEDPAQRPALHAAALDLLDLADAYYESARLGLAALPLRSAWAVAAARRVYRGIGAELRRRGPEAWSSRVSTSAPRKLALTIAALVDVIGSRLASAEKPRGDLWRRP